MARKTDEVKRLEAKEAEVEAFIQSATEDQVRTMLSRIFSEISTDYISNIRFPGMYESSEEKAMSDAKEFLRGDLFDTFTSWAKK